MCEYIDIYRYVYLVLVSVYAATLRPGALKRAISFSRVFEQHINSVCSNTIFRLFEQHVMEKQMYGIIGIVHIYIYMHIYINVLLSLRFWALRFRVGF